MELGADLFLIKPLEPDVLLDAINKFSSDTKPEAGNKLKANVPEEKILKNITNRFSGNWKTRSNSWKKQIISFKKASPSTDPYFKNRCREYFRYPQKANC